MTVLFDVEKFGNPKTDNILIDVFLEIKSEILKALQDSEKRFDQITIVIIMTPSEQLRMQYLTAGSETLVDELNEYLGDRMDLSQIASRILNVDNN